MARILTLNLSGYIYPDEWLWSDESGISKARVERQINAAGEIDEIVMMIDSYGGEMPEGWKIFDYVRSLGIPVKTIILGNCCSMAVALFLLGKTRLISPNSTFMVHLPAFDYIGGDKNDLQAYMDILIQEEEKLLNLYTEVTGQEESVIAGLLAAETWMKADETVSYGFATGLYVDVKQSSSAVENSIRHSIKLRNSAGAKRPEPVNLVRGMKRPDRDIPAEPQPVALNGVVTVTEDEISDDDLTKLINYKMAKSNLTVAQVIKNLFGSGDAAKKAAENALKTDGKLKNVAIGLTDGRTLTIDAAGEEPAAGDPCTIDGETAPDGTYESDTMTYTVVDGVLSVDPVTKTDTADDVSNEPPKDTNTGAQPTDVKTLQNQLKAMTKERNTLQNKVKELESSVNRMTPIVKNYAELLGAVNSAEVPQPAKNTTVKTGTTQGVNAEESEREEMLENRSGRDWSAMRTGIKNKGREVAKDE